MNKIENVVTPMRRVRGFWGGSKDGGISVG
jgi:hypothetical protein